MMAVEMERDTDLELDLKIMALTVWAEARGEPSEGQRAVAWVIRNRVARPGWWSRAERFLYGSIAAVCRCPWQFSCWNSSDPNRARLDDPKTRERADYLAIRALCENVLVESQSADPSRGADHYCTKAVSGKTKWARTRTPCAEIGNHRFYRVGLNGERQ